MRRLLLAVCVYVSLGVSCPGPTPAPIPDPTPFPTRTLVFFVDRSEAIGTLRPDSFQPIDCPRQDQALVCVLAAQETGGATFTIEAEGYQSQSLRVVLSLTDDTYPEHVILAPIVAPMQRLRADGKRMLREDGTVFAWQGITAFQLIDDIADGRESKAIALLDWAASNNVTILRTFSVLDKGLFTLCSQDGIAALPRTLELAAQRGLYLEIVGLTGTKDYLFDHRVHISQISHICGAFTNCVLELANEPNHASQSRQVASPDYLASLARLVDARIPVSLGAAHGPDDESMDYVGGTYVTVHTNRCQGDDGWCWVRHAREIQAFRDRIHQKYAVSDEPARFVPEADKHLAYGLLMRIYGLGDTVHYASGLHADIPVGDDLAAFESHRSAWALVPDDWSNGRYTAAHLADSPVRVNDKVLRAYSSLRGNTGLTLLIKADDGADIRWQNGWVPTLVASMGKTKLFKVNRYLNN